MSNRHAFLRKITDSMKKLFSNRLIKSPKYMAVGAYALSFFVFVSYFENSFSIFPQKASYCVSAAGYQEVIQAKEETSLAKLTSNLKDSAQGMLTGFVDQLIKPVAQEALNQQTVTLMSEKETKDTNQPAAETLSERAKALPAGLKVTHNKAMIKKVSTKELEVLHRIVEAEATGEDIYGKILVANVVLNRVNAKEFPNTISEVVFQKTGKSYQFSPILDKRYWKVKVSDSTIEAVSRALSGEDYSNGALYFFARRLTSKRKASWFDHQLRKVMQYGYHEFYANK